MDEHARLIVRIAHSLNRRIVREKILAHRVPEILEQEVRAHNVPENEILAVRLEVDSLARKLRVEALRKRLA